MSADVVAETLDMSSTEIKVAQRPMRKVTCGLAMFELECGRTELAPYYTCRTGTTQQSSTLFDTSMN